MSLQTKLFLSCNDLVIRFNNKIFLLNNSVLFYLKKESK